MSKRKTKPIQARRRKDSGDDSQEPADGTRQTTKWWKQESGGLAAAALWTWVDRLRPQLVADNFDDLIHEAIYEGRPLASIGVSRGLDALRSRRSSPANLNLARSMVDTATARLTKKRTMPVVSAQNAGWSEKRFAKSTSRVLRAKLGSSRLESLKPTIIRDMIIRGDGVAKIVRNGGDVDVDRVPIFELVYDPREAMHGEPRCLAHCRPMDRDVMVEEFPEHEEAINAAATFKRADQWTQHAYQGITFADHVEVAEGWHLPSGPKADDGQHIIAIRGVVLLREPWKRPRFPFPRCHWSAPLRGFRGHGLVEDLTGIQAKVNDLIKDAQEALYFGSMLKIFQARTSNVNKHHLRARHPVVVEYDGMPPSFVAPNPVSEQTIKILLLLWEKAYEISGINQMAAASKSTLGSNASGKALDTMEDIQSDRFAHVESGWMQFIVEVGRGICDEARAMAEEAKAGDEGKTFDEQPDPIAKADLAPWIAEHDWTKVLIDEGDFHLTLEPINFLPDSRAGKLSFVAEMSKAGLIPDPTMTADLFDEPDIARMNRATLGPKHNIDRALEGLASEEVPMLELMPDPSWNLELAVLMAKGERNEAQAEEAPPEVIDRYDGFINQCERLIKLARSGAVSLPGMQSTAMGAAPNAATLQPGLAGPPMPVPGAPPPGMDMGPGMPPGAMIQ